jgi:hypothetical protein
VTVAVEVSEIYENLDKIKKDFAKLKVVAKVPDLK